MTNGDKIRSMSDSEYADWLCEHNLEIYDTPKKLGEFSPPFENCIGKVCDEFGCASCENGGHIKRPPQSWCYVEGLENG